MCFLYEFPTRFSEGSGSQGPLYKHQVRVYMNLCMVNTPQSPVFQGGEDKLLNFILSKLKPTLLLVDPFVTYRVSFPQNSYTECQFQHP